MRIYFESHDPAYLVPLKKGLEFILEAQYPNGGWPQRYPLSNEYSHDGVPDYTSYYTFNDGVIPNCIFLLVEAWEKLGDERQRAQGLDGLRAFHACDPTGRVPPSHDRTRGGSRVWA